MSDNKPKHWLYRPENLPKLWRIQVVILLLVVLPEFFIQRHAYFESLGIHVDGSWGFYAWYGFLTCMAMVVGAKLLGTFLKRREDYYDE